MKVTQKAAEINNVDGPVRIEGTEVKTAGGETVGRVGITFKAGKPKQPKP